MTWPSSFFGDGRAVPSAQVVGGFEILVEVLADHLCIGATVRQAPVHRRPGVHDPAGVAQQHDHLEVCQRGVPEQCLGLPDPHPHRLHDPHWKEGAGGLVEERQEAGGLGGQQVLAGAPQTQVVVEQNWKDVAWLYFLSQS